MQGSHFLPPPKVTEGQDADQTLSPSAKVRENNSQPAKGNPTLGAGSRENVVGLLRRLGKQADEAREKRQRVDNEGAAKTVQSRQSAVKEQEQEENGGYEREQRVKDAQKLLTWWQASLKELASIKQPRRTKGIGAIRRKRVTQLKFQDAVASPSGASEESDLVSTKGVLVTFIVKEHGETRKETVPATEVEQMAWQYKKRGYNI